MRNLWSTTTPLALVATIAGCQPSEQPSTKPAASAGHPADERSQPQPAPPGGPEEALARVEPLSLLHGAAFSAWPEAPVLALRTQPLAPEHAEAVWQQLYAKRTTLGMTPVVISPAMDTQVVDAATHAATILPSKPSDALERVRALHATSVESFRAWCTEHSADDADALAECDDDPAAEDIAAMRKAELLPGPPQPSEFSFPTFDARLATSLAASGLDDAGHEVRKLRVLLLGVPAWEVAAVFGYGGWNACPMPADHVAIHKDWYTRHGASLAYLDRDVLEFYVERPPTDIEATKRLAEEQYLYCGDIVEQGVGTSTALAAGLRTARHWYFWWD